MRDQPAPPKAPARPPEAEPRRTPAARPAQAAVPTDAPEDGGPPRRTEATRSQVDSQAEADVGERSGEAPWHPGVPLSPPGIVPESDVRVHSPAAAQPHHHDGPSTDKLGELPAGYCDGRLVTLMRDPRTVFVYWDLSQGHLDQAFHGLGQCRALLKLWSAPQGGEFLREVEVELESHGWYLRDLPAGIDLRVELWAVGERGARLIRSARPVRLPSAEPSSVCDELYVSIPLQRRLGRGEPVSGSQPLQWRSGQPAAPEVRLAPQRFLGSSERIGVSSDRFLGSSGNSSKKEGK